MSVYPPPLNQSPIFNPSAFTETVTSVIGGSGTTPTVDYLEYPEAQGPETFTNNGGNNTLVVGASELSIGYDVLTVPKGIAFSGQGFAYNNGTVVSNTTWSGLQTKIEAVQALAPASDATTLNVNDAICIQNGESPTATNTIILSTSAGDNQLLLNDSAGTAGYVLTSGGPDGSMTWEAGGGSSNLLTEDNTWTGTNTFNEGISLAPSKYITTGGGAGAPSATQIGGEVVGTILNPLPSNLTSNGWYSVGENLSLSSGVWLIYGVITIGTLQDATDFQIAFGTSRRTGGASNTGAFNIGISTNYVNLAIPQALNITSVYRNTTADPVVVYFNVKSTSGGFTPVASGTNFLFKAYKLA